MIRPIEHPGGSYTGFDISFVDILRASYKLHPNSLSVLITVPGNTS